MINMRGLLWIEDKQGQDKIQTRLCKPADSTTAARAIERRTILSVFFSADHHVNL